jgi:ABC-type glycerol-3-phosphate transport system permease component
MNLTIAVLFIELTLFALLGVTLLLGDLDQGLPFYAVLGGASALAAGMINRRAGTQTGHLMAHGALILGCILFAFPFVWLVGSSFKYDEELFVYPPRWIPSMPPAVQASPYATAESLPPLVAPTELPDGRWSQLWPQLEQALWQRAVPLLSLDAPPADTQLRPAFGHGLFALASQALPQATWRADDATIVAALSARVDADLISAVREAVYRSVELRPLTVKDQTHQIHPLPTGDPIQWKTSAGAVRLAGTTPLTLAYSFDAHQQLGLVADMQLPIEPSAFLGFTLPMRQDRSWHSWRVVLEIDGRRYIPEDDLYLGQRRWQEIGFKLKERDSRDERDLGIWPLVPADNQQDAFDHPGRFLLRLEIEAASSLQTAWRKYMDNYRNAYIATEHRWDYVFNSLYLTVMSILGQVISCSLVAYAFSRLEWPGREWIFGLLLATMMLPPQVTMIPVFMIFRYLGWYNSLKALWAPSFFGSAFFIFMLRQFMKGIPNDLEDAAKIDGCSLFGIYWRIILPLVKPALAAVCIFTFMGTWNDFMGPLIYVNDQRLYPLALGLFDFRSEHGSEFGMLMAASTLMTLPVIAIFFLAQKYFIQGVTLTGMKG